jgi:flagellar biosynthesis chaperone FliJ
VRVKQEEAKKAELLAITQRLLEARQAVIIKQAQMRSVLLTLSRKDALTRIAEQPTIVRHMAFSEEELKALRKKADEIEIQRKKKTEEMVAARKARRAMEKLQEKAKAEYVKIANAVEQKELDDFSGVRFVRNRAEAVASGTTE